MSHTARSAYVWQIYDTATVIKLTFNELIEKVCKQEHTLSSPPPRDFSAAEHLFVSHHVARTRPELLESMLVLSYRSPTVSNDLRAKWKTNSSGGTSSWASPTISGVLTVVPYLLTSLLMAVGSLPTSLQEVVVGLSNPIFIGAIAFMGNAVFHSTLIGVPVMSAIVFIVCAALFWATLSFDHHRHPADKVVPVQDVQQSVDKRNSRKAERRFERPPNGSAKHEANVLLEKEAMEIFAGAKGFLARLEDDDNDDDDFYDDNPSEEAELAAVVRRETFIRVIGGDGRLLTNADDDLNSDELEIPSGSSQGLSDVLGSSVGNGSEGLDADKGEGDGSDMFEGQSSGNDAYSSSLLGSGGAPGSGSIEGSNGMGMSDLGAAVGITIGEERGGQSPSADRDGDDAENSLLSGDSNGASDARSSEASIRL